jgi:hypothetical protein
MPVGLEIAIVEGTIASQKDVTITLVLFIWHKDCYSTGVSSRKPLPVDRFGKFNWKARSMTKIVEIHTSDVSEWELCQ